jgi:hypothetical protein
MARLVSPVAMAILVSLIAIDIIRDSMAPLKRFPWPEPAPTVAAPPDHVDLAPAFQVATA